jgi:hypothetical protein
VKPSPRHDFPVGVSAARNEHAAEYARAFAGIYTVTLNHAISIELVPTVDRRPPWPPELPEDVDCPASSDEARRTAIRLARYAVTPDAQRAGGVERLPAELDAGVVFFVELAEFDALIAECEALEQRFSGPHDAVPVSTLGTSRLARLLHERVLASGQLSAYELGVLGRAPVTP